MYKPHTSIEIFSRFFKGFVALEIIIDLPFGFFPINNIISLISIILAGHYVCSEDLLEARVVLLCCFWFPPDRICQVEMICIGGVPVLKRHFGGAGPQIFCMIHRGGRNGKSKPLAMIKCLLLSKNAPEYFERGLEFWLVLRHGH